MALIKGHEKQQAFNIAQQNTFEFLSHLSDCNSELEHFTRVLQGNITVLKEDDVYSSSYVVHSLEASIWSFLSTDSFESAVLKAVNLGHDSDTITALTGALAGLYYGYNSIPNVWLNQIARYDDIDDLANRFSLFVNSKK